MQLDSLVGEYIEKVRDYKGNHRWGFLPRYNPELANLSSGVRVNRDLGDRVFDVASQEGVSSVLDIARKFDDSYTSGLVMGYTFPDEEVFNGRGSRKQDFNSGFNNGQAYRLKSANTSEKVKGFLGASFLLGGIGSFVANSPYMFSQENLEIISKISDVTHKLALASVGYGVFSMLRSGLFGNDMNLSEELVTDGPFAMHRNPYYFGLLTAMGSVCVSTLLSTGLSENPNYLSAAFTSLGACVVYSRFMEKMKTDEKVLERQFGDEYIDYKNDVPRLFPNPFNLFRRRE